MWNQRPSLGCALVMSLGLALLAGPHTALAQSDGGECEAWLEDRTIDRQHYEVQSGSEAVDHVTLEPAQGAAGVGAPVAVRTLRQRSAEGTREVSVATYVCEGSRALLREITGGPHADRLRFDPPLVWLQFPLEAGNSWEWEGTVTAETEQGSETAQARFSATVAGSGSVDIDGYPAESLQVDTTLSLGAVGPTTRTQRHLANSRGRGLMGQEVVIESEGQETTETWSLFLGMGRLNVSSSPPGVLIIDGESTGVSTPVEDYELPPGRYDVQVEHEGGILSGVQSVEVRRHVRTSLSFQSSQ